MCSTRKTTMPNPTRPDRTNRIRTSVTPQYGVLWQSERDKREKNTDMKSTTAIVSIKRHTSCTEFIVVESDFLSFFEFVHLHVMGRSLWCEDGWSYCSLDLQPCSCSPLHQYKGALMVNSASCWDLDWWSGSQFHPLYTMRWTRLVHFLQSRAQSSVLDLGEPPMS